MRVRLYDPHPGLMGCPNPLPEPMRILINQLDGTVHELGAVLVILQDEAIRIADSAVIRNSDEHKMISLRIGNFKTGMDCWRLLHYETLSS